MFCWINYDVVYIVQFNDVIIAEFDDVRIVQSDDVWIVEVDDVMDDFFDDEWSIGWIWSGQTYTHTDTQTCREQLKAEQYKAYPNLGPNV